jgi:hypothetical protein
MAAPMKQGIGMGMGNTTLLGKIEEKMQKNAQSVKNRLDEVGMDVEEVRDHHRADAHAAVEGSEDSD